MDDVVLLRQARALDERALGEIFDQYYERLYRYIYHHIRHTETAEDLAAEVFQRLLADLHRKRGPSDHLKAWLYRVATNLIIDEARRNRHRLHDELSENLKHADPLPEEQTARSLDQARAWEALKRLPERQRTVVILKYLEGLDNREVADVTGLTVAVVKALQHRGLEGMRRTLAAEQGRGGWLWDVL